MAIDLNGIVTWLSGWFAFKGTENRTLSAVVNDLTNSIDSKLNSNLTQANKNLVTNSSGEVVLEDKPNIPDVSGKIDTAGTGLSKSGTTLNHSNSIASQTSTVFKKIKYDGQGHITGTANVTASDLPSHTHSIANVSNLQTELNNLDTRIDALESFEFIKVVSDKGTASASTMNTLYVVQETDATTSEVKVNVYYTKKDGSSYSWVKLDDNILDELDLDWNNITNNPFINKQPSDFANSTHNHSISDITNLQTTLNGKQDIGDCITSIELVPKSEDNTGAIRLYYGDEE